MWNWTLINVDIKVQEYDMGPGSVPGKVEGVVTGDIQEM